ncbi:MAG: PilN domain-containing protein [Actinomycetota bacterium]
MMRRIDLLPASYAERRIQRRNLGLAVVSGLVILGLLLAWWVMLGGQVSDANSDLDAVQARNRSLQAEIAELQRFADLQAEVQSKEAALDSIMAGDLAWPSLMTEVAMVIPGEVWLTNWAASAGMTEGATPVESEAAEVRVSQKPPVGRISFTGKALSMPGIAKWLIRLEGSKSFSGVWLENAAKAEAEEGTSTEVIDFTNTVELNQKAFSLRFLRGER